jgi:hypothetical protein
LSILIAILFPEPLMCYVVFILPSPFLLDTNWVL